MTPDELTGTWGTLAREALPSSREVRRRIVPEAPADVFAFVMMADGLPGVEIRAVAEGPLPETALPSSKGVRLESKVEHLSEGGVETVFTLRLEDATQASVFATLCTDVVTQLARCPDGRTALLEARSRIARWMSLLARVRPEGLSRERRLGLLGEMLVLERILAHVEPLPAVMAWQGWEEHNQDFRVGGLGIEVKTTGAKRHARISISNERQLDEAPWATLILACLELESEVPEGPTLPELIVRVRNLVATSGEARLELDLRLHEYGYVDAQAHLYADEHHHLLRFALLHVRDDFPRLTERNLPQGVGDIRYSIVSGDLGAYEVNESTFATWLTGGVA